MENTYNALDFLNSSINGTPGALVTKSDGNVDIDNHAETAKLRAARDELVELLAATRAFLTDDGSPNLHRILKAMGPFGGVAP